MFQKIGKAYLSVSLIYILLGIAMLIAKDQFLHVAFYILGGALALFGLVGIISHFAKAESIIGLTGGIISFVLGLYMLLNGKNITDFLFFVFGLILLADNAANLTTVFELRKAGLRFWWIALLCTLILMGSGILILFNPSWMAKAVIYVVGALFILNGISNLVNYFMARSGIRNMKKAAAGQIPAAVYNEDGSSYNPEN